MAVNLEDIELWPANDELVIPQIDFPGVCSLRFSALKDSLDTLISVSCALMRGPGPPRGRLELSTE